MASSSGSIFSFFKKKKKEGRRGGPSSTRASASDPGWENPNDFRFLGTAGDIIQAPNWQEVAKFPLPKTPKGGASEAKSADYHEQVIAKPSAPQLALLMAGPKPKYVETELVTDASDPHAHHECTVCFDTKELFDFHVISGCTLPNIIPVSHCFFLSFLFSLISSFFSKKKAHILQFVVNVWAWQLPKILMVRARVCCNALPQAARCRSPPKM